MNSSIKFLIKIKRHILFLCILLLSVIPTYASETIETSDSVNLPKEASYIVTDSIESATNSPKSLCRNLFVEFGGPSFGIVGLGFDSRFKPGCAFGYRVGLSFVDGSYINHVDDQQLYYNGVNIPLEVNAIMGKRKSKFELGLGAVPSILHRKEYVTEYYWTEDKDGYGEYNYNYTTKEGIRLNIMGIINIGYRYQRQSGFFMRVGFTFLLGDLKCSPIDGIFLIPNIAFGYTLR